MPWKKKENGLGVGKGNLWLWFRKVQFKTLEGKAVTVNVTRGRSGGAGLQWENVGTVFLCKEDVQQLFVELQHMLESW